MGRRFEHLGLEVRDDDKGRGLYCTRSFAAGELLLVGAVCCEAPLLVGLPELWKSSCAKCFATEFDDELRSCKEYARGHKEDNWQELVCYALSISRLLRLLHSGLDPPTSRCASVAVSLDDLAELCTPNEDVWEDLEGFAELLAASPLNSLFPADLHGPDLATVISHCYEQLACNSFLICGPAEKPVGQLCDPISGLLNHSCKPNAAMVWQVPVNGRTHMVRCIRDLQAGEEVLISYVDPSRPWWIRQPTLKASYGFICDCVVCGEINAWERAVGSRADLPLPPGITASIAAVTAADGTVLLVSEEKTRGVCAFLNREMGIAVQAASDKDIRHVADAAITVGRLSAADSLQRGAAEAQRRIEQLRPAMQTLLQLLGPQHMLLRELTSVLRLAEVAGDWNICVDLAPVVLASLAITDGEMSSRKADILAILAVAKLRTAADDGALQRAHAEGRHVFEMLGRFYGEQLPQHAPRTWLRQLLVMDLDSMD
ncbi:smyd2-b [Symbiodinium pilosum]|uniref:Smyd2-b protein n=1 Tax=Symbiodinium pilosum TaxID=2952 RepID=A0A812WER2_SYMPI|nr:smyd2-b [Symbiodinium pilosum]